jgi:hypothetical protein
MVTSAVKVTRGNATVSFSLGYVTVAFSSHVHSVIPPSKSPPHFLGSVVVENADFPGA